MHLCSYNFKQKWHYKNSDSKGNCLTCYCGLALDNQFDKQLHTSWWYIVLVYWRILFKGDILCSFLLLGMVPWCLHGMLVTCFGLKNWRIERSKVLYTPVSQPCSKRPVFPLHANELLRAQPKDGICTAHFFPPAEDVRTALCYYGNTWRREVISADKNAFAHWSRDLSLVNKIKRATQWRILVQVAELVWAEIPGARAGIFKSPGLWRHNPGEIQTACLQTHFLTADYKTLT